MKLINSKKILEKYSSDASHFSVKPKAVAQPKSEQELIELIKYARKNKFSLHPRGGGSGLSGAALGKGIIIDFTKHFNKIRSISKTTKVQSGILLKDLRPRLKKHNLMLPGVPLHGWCTIGGIINTRAIGPKSLKYGSADKKVKSIRGVLSDETIIDTSKQIPKHIKKGILALQTELKNNKKLLQYIKKRPAMAGGYNIKALIEKRSIQDIITHLIVGSVGTLILVTEVTLDLPREKSLESLFLIPFKDYKEVQKELTKLLKLKPVLLEYVDKKLLRQWGKKYDLKGIGAILVGFERKEELKSTKNKIKIPKKTYVKIWKLRKEALHKTSTIIKKTGKFAPSITDDLTFDPKNFSKIMQSIIEYTKRKKIEFFLYGHLGIGSMHLRLALPKSISNKKIQTIANKIFKILKKHNGTLVGEHNAGPWRAQYLQKESKLMYTFMKKIKKLFDPHNLLNPKAMFPPSHSMKDLNKRQFNKKV